MKNKIYNYIIVVLISLIIIAIINFFAFGFNKINSKLTKNTWYHYDFTTGYYDLLNISNDKIEYKGSNSQNNYVNCYSYSFDKKENIINLDCNKKINIKKYSDKSLELKMDDYEKVFFNNVEDSLNYEFKNYFGKSIVDFKNEKSQVVEYSKINSDKLIGISKEKGYSKVIFIGNNCTSIDCTLALDIMEKWIIKSSNIYFFDANEVNESLLKTISKTIKDINKDTNFYNGIYPKVLILKNSKIIDNYDIKCNGFNCNSLYKNEF